MKKYNAHSGWFLESRRHSLASMGIKTGRKSSDVGLGLSKINYATDVGSIKKHTSTKYLSDAGFQFTFEPVEDSITVKELPDGYEIKYLTPDESPESPEEWGDDNLLLVHYHRDFDIRRDKIITEDDARRWYQGEKIEQEKKYWIIPVEAYIHSGVSLAISERGNFPDRQWDVSHVGLALVSKEEFKSKAKAEKAVAGLLESWNTYLSGDVYTMVVERYDKNKEQIDRDNVGGLYGYKYALEELKTFEPDIKIPQGQKKVTDFAKKRKLENGYHNPKGDGYHFQLSELLKDSKKHKKAKSK